MSARFFEFAIWNPYNANRMKKFLPFLALAALCGCTHKAAHPNVLIVTFDTTRADHVGCYAPHAGYTPNIDALAAEGSVFENARTTCPLTLPSHTTILTGATPLRHGLRVNDAGRLPSDVPSIAELFQTNNYETAAFVSAVVLDKRFGLDRGFDHYDDRLPDPKYGSELRENLGAAMVPASIDGAETTSRFLAWLGARADDARPWFSWVHFYDPHGPHDPHPEFRSHGATDEYSQEISYTDSLLGRIVAHLKRTGQYRNTIIVVLADHGESLGEHGELTHGMTLYDGTLHIPLVVKPSDGMEWRLPRRVKDNVSNADIAPTLALGVLGVSWRAEEHEAAGRPFQSIAAGANGAVRKVYSETINPEVAFGWAPLAAITRDDWKYIETPRSELYDLAADPHENDNRAGPDDDIAESMALDLDAIRGLTTTAEPAALPLDHEMIERLRSLGYTAGGDTAKRAAASRAATSDDTRMDIKDALPDLNAYHELKASLAGGFCTTNDFERLKGIISRMPDSPSFLLTYAGMSAFFGDEDEAERVLIRIGELKPDDPDAFGALGSLYLSQDRFEEAAYAYARSIEVGGGLTCQPLAAARIGHIDLLIGDLNGATNMLAASRPFLNEHRAFDKRIGDALLRLGDVDGAIAAYDLALAEQPDWASAIEGGAWARMVSENEDERKRALRDAYSLRLLSDRREPRDLETLAAAYAANGKFKEALATAHEALGILKGEIELPPPPPEYFAAFEGVGAKWRDPAIRQRFFDMVAARLEAAIPDWEAGKRPTQEFAARRLADLDYLMDAPIRQSKPEEY